MKARSLTQNKAGFTVVELMIATLVFSVVLLVVTMGIIQFSRSYYRGAIAAKTQDTARSLMDAVAQSLQFGVVEPDMGVNDASVGASYFCAGGYKFIYTKGVKYTGADPTLSNAGVYMVTSKNACDPPTSPVPAQGDQLLNDDMRVTDLTVSELDLGKYSVSATVVYGDNDLICDAEDAATCSSTATSLTDTQIAALGSDAKCKLLKGSEFCAVSTLSTIVKKRIQ